MKNLLFVTVGTSSLSQVKRPEETLTPEQEQAWCEQLFKAHKSYWEQSEPYTASPANFLKSSAELTSTAALVRLLNQGRPLRLDQMILLVSANPDGRMAGRLVKAIMETKDYPAPVTPDRIALREIPGPEGEWINLKSALLEAVSEFRDDERDRCYFNITGGYKGVAAMIGLLANKHGFRLYYQHEKLATPVFIREDLAMSRNSDVWTDSLN